jgi:hypothetical protein
MPPQAASAAPAASTRLRRMAEGVDEACIGDSSKMFDKIIVKQYYIVNKQRQKP